MRCCAVQMPRRTGLPGLAEPSGEAGEYEGLVGE